jgi:HD superfamily phosphodiesterase
MATEALAIANAPVLTGSPDAATSWLDWLGVAFSSTPHRFQHVHMVWQRAVRLRRLELRWLDPSRANRLELAALLHDVGRALDPGDTEPHGFVGARLLDCVGLSDVAPLVAHHSGARHEADARGMAHLDLWRVDEPELLAVLTFLDRTTSASGDRVSLGQRRSDISSRYGASSLPVRVFDATLPEIRHAARLLRV